MRKALILGAGGTGARVIMRMRDIVEWRRNEHISDHPNIQYYEIDTDPDSLTDNSNKSLHLKVTDDQVTLFKGGMAKGHNKWADKDGITSVSKGAGETRVKGKFAFLCHYDRIKQEVQNRLSDLYAAEEGSNQKKRIYIVANSVSGTGSGCFIDYGYLIREIIRSNPTYRNDVLLNVTLILTLPVSYNNPTHLRNSYYALEELNHFMSGNLYSIEHATRQGTILRMDADTCPYGPFDYVYLIGPKAGENTENQGLEDIIGEYIYNDIFSPSANIRDSARDNMNKYELRKDRTGSIQKYMTFGFSTIEYPRLQISKAATYKYIMNSLSEWCKGSGEQVNYAFDRLLLVDGDFKTEGSIYNELLKETSVTIYGDNVQTMNITEMIKNLTESAFENFKENEYETLYINRLLDSIDLGFKEGNFSGGDFGNGTVRAVIQENERKLKSEESGWSYKIKDALLTLMLSNSDGLRLAKDLMGSINARLDSIAGKNSNDQIYADIRSEIEFICSEIENIRTDKLLRFGGLQKWPIDQRIKKCRNKINQYIEARLNNVAIEAAKEIASRDSNANRGSNIRRSLDNFTKRIDRFEKDITEWVAALSKDYADTISPQILNGHIVWRNRIGTLADDLITTARRNMFDFIGGSLANTLRERIMQEEDANSNRIIIRRMDRDHIINLEKSNFINLLGDKKVIAEFLREEMDRTDNYNNNSGGGHIDILTNVNDSAELFIDMHERDNYANTDENTLSKKWFFYPGGHAVGNANEASNSSVNPFATELHSRQLIHNWTEQSQDSSDDRIILILNEKAGFPLRYLNLLYEEQMMNALEGAQNLENVAINTFRSRIDVDFMPLKIIDAALLNRVKVLFVESIATGKLVLSGNQEFVYGKEGSVNIFDFIGVHESLKLPNIYKSAPYKLYKNREAQNRLREDNENYVQHNKVDFLQTLHNLLFRFEAYGLIVTDTEKKEIRRLMVDEYIRPKGLRNDWNELFTDLPIPEMAQQYFAYVEQVDDNDPVHPRVGWYCRACEQFVGDTHSESDLNELKQIHVCSR